MVVYFGGSKFGDRVEKMDEEFFMKLIIVSFMAIVFLIINCEMTGMFRHYDAVYECTEVKK